MGHLADLPISLQRHSSTRRKQKVVAPKKAKEGLLEKEEVEEMNHMDFDPRVIRERNEQMRSEIESLRLEERLHKERDPRGSRLGVLIRRGRLLIGGARPAG